MKKFNKRGEGDVGNKMMSLWFVFVLVVMAGGIIIAFSIYFGAGYEFRGSEAGVLNYKIRECLAEKNIDWNNESDFYFKCGFSEEVLSKRLEETKIKIMVCEDSCEYGKMIFQLGSDFVACDLIGKNEKYPMCVKRMLTKGDENIEVIVGSNHRSVKSYA